MHRKSASVGIRNSVLKRKHVNGTVTKSGYSIIKSGYSNIYTLKLAGLFPCWHQPQPWLHSDLELESGTCSEAPRRARDAPLRI